MDKIKHVAKNSTRLQIRVRSVEVMSVSVSVKFGGGVREPEGSEDSSLPRRDAMSLG